MSTTTDNPARTFFGTELRRRRDEAGLTGKQLADSLGCTPQWISVMEGGKKISEQSAHDLDTYFKTGGLFHRLWKLANDIELQTTLPPGFPEYVEREKRATTVRASCGMLVNGLFQTEGYAQAVLGAMDGPNTSELVAKRMERKNILERETPPLIWVVLDESILRRIVGTTEVMRQQLAALLSTSDRPDIMVQVVPYRAGYHAGLGGDFTILGFEDGSSLAYTESAGIGTLINRPSEVTMFTVRWDLLRGCALPVDESRSLIKTALEGL